jgi:hypothetical protein
MLYEAYPRDCPIRPGFRVGRYFFGLFGPTVENVGALVRIGGGWIAPVQFTSGECALLRHYREDGDVFKGSVVEWISTSGNVQALLRNSARLPEVFVGADPQTLYLKVSDVEYENTTDEIEAVYELRFARILGNHGGKDVVVPTSARWM